MDLWKVLMAAGIWKEDVFILAFQLDPKNRELEDYIIRKLQGYVHKWLLKWGAYEYLSEGLKALRAVIKYWDPAKGPLLPYLKKSVQFEIRQEKKRKREYEALPADIVAEEKEIPEFDLKCLTGEERQCIVMRYWFDMTLQEIADERGCHYQQIQTILRKAYDKLRRSYNEN